MLAAIGELDKPPEVAGVGARTDEHYVGGSVHVGLTGTTASISAVASWEHHQGDWSAATGHS